MEELDDKLQERAQNHCCRTFELANKTLEDGQKARDDIFAKNASETREEADEEAESDVNGERESNTGVEGADNRTEDRNGCAEPGLNSLQDDLDRLLGDGDASSGQKLRTNVTNIFEEFLKLIIDQFDAFRLADGARLDLGNGHIYGPELARCNSQQRIMASSY